MKFVNSVFVAILLFLTNTLAAFAKSQRKTQKAESKPPESPEEDAQKKNLQAYVNLLRSDVRQQKAEIMGSVMALSASDAAKFWPIYSQYEAELTKLNDQRVDNIKEYARTYTEMTA